MKVLTSTICIWLLSGCLAYGQGSPVAGDPVATQRDLGDLRKSLFELIQAWDGRMSRAKIEAIMQMHFLPDGNASAVYASGYRSLEFDQYFDPAPPAPKGSSGITSANYVGVFQVVPFGEKAGNCLSVGQFRAFLAAHKEWREGETRYYSADYNARLDNGTGFDTTEYTFFRNLTVLKLTTFGNGGLANAPVGATAGNDCVLEAGLS